jgi:branched-subunit amino acid transport protein
MTDIWIAVIVVGAVTMAFKAAGPVFIGRRPLPRRVRAVVDLLAPVMLTALVVTQTFASGQSVTVDARVPGVLAGAIAVWRGVHLIPAMVIAAVVTGLVRLVGG